MFDKFTDYKSASYKILNNRQTYFIFSWPPAHIPLLLKEDKDRLLSLQEDLKVRTRLEVTLGGILRLVIRLCPLDQTLKFEGAGNPGRWPAAVIECPSAKQKHTLYVGDVAHVPATEYAVQTNIVRTTGARAALLTVLKNGGSSTLDIVAQIKAMLPRIRSSTSRLGWTLKLMFDQSLFVRAAIDGIDSRSHHRGGA